MLTVEEFKLKCPEFGAAPTSLVQVTLEETALEIDPEVWGDKEDTAHKLLTAHRLAISPFGNTAKLVQNGSTTYEKQYTRLCKIVCAGRRTT